MNMDSLAIGIATALAIGAIGVLIAVLLRRPKEKPFEEVRRYTRDELICKRVSELLQRFPRTDSYARAAVEFGLSPRHIRRIYNDRRK